MANFHLPLDQIHISLRISFSLRYCWYKLKKINVIYIKILKNGIYLNKKCKTYDRVYKTPPPGERTSYLAVTLKQDGHQTRIQKDHPSLFHIWNYTIILILLVKERRVQRSVTWSPKITQWRGEDTSGKRPPLTYPTLPLNFYRWIFLAIYHPN